MSSGDNNLIVGGYPMQEDFQNSVPPAVEDRQAASSVPISDMGMLTPAIMALLLMTGIKRCWKWTVPVGAVLGAVAAALLWGLTPDQYESTAWILIRSNAEYLAFKNDADRGASDVYINTQLAYFKNPLILEKVVSAPQIAKMSCFAKEKDPAQWLQRNLSVGGSRKTGDLYPISISCEDPVEAKTLIDAVVAQYQKYYLETQSNTSENVLRILSMELDKKKHAVRGMQESIRRKIEAINSDSSAGPMANADGTQAASSASDSLYKEMILAQANYEEALSTYEDAKNTNIDDITIPPFLVERGIEEDVELFQMNTNKLDVLTKIETRRAQLQPAAQKDDDILQSLREQATELERKIQQKADGLYDEVVQKQKKALLYEMQKNLVLLEENTKRAYRRLELIRTKYEEQNRRGKERSRDMVEVVFEQQQLARDNAVLDQITTRIVALQTEKNAPDRVQLLESAKIPKEPRNKMRVVMAAFAGLALFCFPTLLGVGLEFMRPRLYHASQLHGIFPELIIGEIMAPPIGWVQGKNFKKMVSRYRESVHNWCMHLLLSSSFKKARTIAITSVAGDDGKTFLAVQIAVSMAQMKSGPVLLIDGDMRVGRLHLLFGNEESGIGLADVLTFRNGIGEAVVMNEKEPNLHLLSTGHLDISPYELLGDGRFRELLDTLEKHYSLILVVAPPVAHAAESLLMASAVDSTILCVRQSETVMAAMKDVLNKMIATGCQVDGIVVKDIPYYQMSGKDGGYSDKVEQIRLAHLLQYIQ